jgi:hypothetical protein
MIADSPKKAEGFSETTFKPTFSGLLRLAARLAEMSSTLRTSARQYE